MNTKDLVDYYGVIVAEYAMDFGNITANHIRDVKKEILLRLKMK